MSLLWKILFFIMVFILLTVFYFIYTTSGTKLGYQLLSYGFSKKTDLDIELLSLNTRQYPFIKADLIVEKDYTLKVQGFINKPSFNMTYSLTSKCVKSTVCTIDDMIHIEGRAKGILDDINITGKGKVLGGTTHYSLIKKNNQYKDILLVLKDINSTNLLALMGQEAIFSGKADARLAFDYIAENTKKGKILYDVKDKNFSGLQTDVHITINIKDEKHTFFIDVLSPGLALHLTDGKYNQKEKKAHALFSLKIKELSKLENILGSKYHGAFNAQGDIAYDTLLKLKGHTQSIGGLTQFNYTNNIIETSLDSIPLATIGTLLGKKTKYDGNVSGLFKYNTKTKIISSKTFNLMLPKHHAKGKIEARLSSDIQLKFDGKIDKHYDVILDGLMGDSLINMDYTLKTKRFPSHIVTIEDNVSVSGHLSGSVNRLHITGEGTVLDGHMQYNLVKLDTSLENVSIKLKDIRSLKLTTLLGYPKLLDGNVSTNVLFDTISQTSQQGHMDYTFNGNYKKIPIKLTATAKVQKNAHTFQANIALKDTDINITKGNHNTQSNKIHAFYSIHSPKLGQLEPLLGFKYSGVFDAFGEIEYNKTLQIKGLSKTFNGMLDFKHKNNLLEINLNAISFKKFMSLFSYPLMLDADTTGKIVYDFNKERLSAQTKLLDAKLLPTTFVDTVRKKAGVDLQKELFTDSKLFATYHNGIILGDIVLTNKKSHLSLTNTKMDSKNNTINGFFDFKLQGEEFSGKVYGSLDDPKVNLDMQKLIRHKMDEQLDTYMGKENRKIMEKMPMGDVAKDVASEVGAGFMGIFF